MIQFQLPEGAKAIELGGGACPSLRPNVDVRMCHDSVGNPTVDLVADFNEPLPLPTGELDLVYSHFCLEHLSWRKVRQFVGEMARILKSGGKAVVVTANTEKQLEVVKKRITGDQQALPDKPDDDFAAYSCILFGDQDYDANTHRNFMSPALAQQLFSEAGFHNIVVRPYGDLQTDMLLEATRDINPATYSPLKLLEEQMNKPMTLEAGDRVVEVPRTKRYIARTEQGIVHSDSLNGPFTLVGDVTNTVEKLVDFKELLVAAAPPPKQETTHPEWYGHDYFDLGEKMGGYRGGYRDFPSHEVTLQHVLARKPESVLDLGCGRGHLVAKLQNEGVRACGMDISRHAWLTRVADGIIEWDCTKTPWPWKDGEFDLCTSVNFFDHVPEHLIPAVVSEMKRVSKKGLHGIDFGPINDGDRTRLVSQGRDWWMAKLPAEHEVRSSQELESGEFPANVLDGDGELKLNIGSCTVMFHRGWTNIDSLDLAAFAGANGYKYLRHDCKTALPFHTGVADLIFTSHFLEHLSYAEGLAFLRECRRIIRPHTGAMRIVVPDAEELTVRYHNSVCDRTGNHSDFGTRKLDEFDEINVECEQAPTTARKLHAVLYSGDHKALYDAETLIHLLDEAGWEGKQDVFRGSLDHPHDGLRQIQRECLDTLQPISLFVNAVPKVGG